MIIMKNKQKYKDILTKSNNTSHWDTSTKYGVKKSSDNVKNFESPKSNKTQNSISNYNKSYTI